MILLRGATILETLQGGWSCCRQGGLITTMDSTGPVWVPLGRYTQVRDQQKRFGSYSLLFLLHALVGTIAESKNLLHGQIQNGLLQINWYPSNLLCPSCGICDWPHEHEGLKAELGHARCGGREWTLNNQEPSAVKTVELL